MGCKLLAGLAGPTMAKAQAFAAALVQANPDFDVDLLEAAAAGPGGECLRGTVLSRLSLALYKNEEKRRRAEQENAAAMAEEGEGGKGGGGTGGDPFEGVPLEISTEDLERDYGDAMGDLVHTQVFFVVMFDCDTVGLYGNCFVFFRLRVCVLVCVCFLVFGEVGCFPRVDDPCFWRGSRGGYGLRRSTAKSGV